MDCKKYKDLFSSIVDGTQCIIQSNGIAKCNNVNIDLNDKEIQHCFIKQYKVMIYYNKTKKGDIFRVVK